MKKELDAAQRCLSELATLMQRIYEDNRVRNDSQITSTKPYLPSMKAKNKRKLKNPHRRNSSASHRSNH